MIRGIAALAALAFVCTLCAATASAKPDAIAHRHEVTALWSIDYWGWKPRNDADLRPYDKEFHKILLSCRINAENLTNVMILLADKASFQGGRKVTTLMMMRAVTRRITWTKRAACGKTFDHAEGHMESGGP